MHLENNYATKYEQEELWNVLFVALAMMLDVELEHASKVSVYLDELFGQPHGKLL